MAKLRQHSIDKDWCKGCGICVAYCPKEVLAIDEHDKAIATHKDNCICCKLCEMRCPDLAITVTCIKGK